MHTATTASTEVRPIIICRALSFAVGSRILHGIFELVGASHSISFILGAPKIVERLFQIDGTTRPKTVIPPEASHGGWKCRLTQVRGTAAA